MAINKIDKFNEKFHKDMSTAFDILKRVVSNTLETAKKCVENLEYLKQKNWKNLPVDSFVKAKCEAKPSTVDILTPSENSVFGDECSMNDSYVDEDVSVKAFKCKLCPFKAKCSLDLKTHIEYHKFKLGYAKCSHCNYYDTDVGKIARHEEMHANCNNSLLNISASTNVDAFSSLKKSDKIIAESILDKIQKSVEGTFDCTFCTFKTKNSKKDLSSHIYNHFQIFAICVCEF